MPNDASVARVTAPQPPAPPRRAALSRELGEFLIEFSIALHKHAMYPQDHPSLEPAAAGVVRRATDLLRDRATLSLGVARNQLIIEGVATDPKHPVLAELAGRLHRHHLGAVTFSQGVATKEVVDMLRTLSVEADRSGQPLGLGPADRLRTWAHVRLHPVTYERLELLEESPPPPPSGDADDDEPAAAGRVVLAAQLWLGLARAALAGQLGADEAPPTKPAVIAKAIDDHPKAEGYDQVIVGYLLQIAEELKRAGGAEAVDLRRRTSRLVKAMRPETLRRLIEMGGDASQRQRFVLDATDGMTVEAVLELVQAAADSSHQTISHSLVRLLSKLAAHAQKGAPAARPLADSALRDQVKQMLSGWTLADPNPDGYGAALQRMSRAAPLFAAASEAMHAADPERMVEMSIEVDQVGPLVWRAVGRMVDEGRLLALVNLLDAAPPGNSVAVAIRTREATPDAVRRTLTGDPPDFATLDRLLSIMGAAAAEPMLDALAVAEARATRRQLLDRLVRLGDALVPLVIGRLGDERWYVVRNLLGLLEDLPHLPEGFSPAPYAAHPDGRVRRQALKLQLKVPAERERALLAALGDADEQTARIALGAALKDCPPGAEPLLIARALARGPSELRVLAIRVLARTRAPAAGDALLRLCDGGRTMFGRPKLAPKSPELLAALTALAGGWALDDRATALLARAAVSGDPEIRAATDPETARI